MAKAAPKTVKHNPRAVVASRTNCEATSATPAKAHPWAMVTPPNIKAPRRGVSPTTAFTPISEAARPAPVSAMAPIAHVVADAKGVQRPAPAPRTTSTWSSCSSRRASAVVNMIAMIATNHSRYPPSSQLANSPTEPAAGRGPKSKRTPGTPRIWDRSAVRSSKEGYMRCRAIGWPSRNSQSGTIHASTCHL